MTRKSPPAGWSASTSTRPSPKLTSLPTSSSFAMNDSSIARFLQTGQQAAEVGRQHVLHLRLDLRVRCSQRLVRSGHHEVGEHLGVVGIDCLRIDAELLELTGRARDDGHHAPARRCLGRLLGSLLLHLLHLRLHLLRLLHQCVDVEAHSPSSLASKVLFISSSTSSSLAGASSAVSPCAFSPSSKETASLRPVTSYSASRRSAVFFGSSASFRWNAAVCGNSSVSVSPSSAAGCASPSVFPIGIERCSTAGRIERRHASWSCSSSTAIDAGGGSGGAGVSETPEPGSEPGSGVTARAGSSRGAMTAPP